jgi:hypothetical protein
VADFRALMLADDAPPAEAPRPVSLRELMLADTSSAPVPSHKPASDGAEADVRARRPLDRERDEPRLLAALAYGPMSCAQLAAALDVDVLQLSPFVNALRLSGKVARADYCGGANGSASASTWRLATADDPAVRAGKGDYDGSIFGPPADRGEHPGDLAGHGHERRMVRELRAKGVPWSAIGNMTGKYVPDLRRRHDPDWKEPT